MRVIASRIPAESHEIAVWPDLPPGDEDTGEDIGVVCNLHHLNHHECMVTKAKGDLSEEVNVQIGLKALALGYQVMHYCVRAGAPSSRHARYVKTANGMDFYTVDLVTEASNL